MTTQNTQNYSSLKWTDAKNSNYLGHWDIGVDGLVLTIKDIKMELIPIPMQEAKERIVVYFYEKNERGQIYKPFICNVTNAEAIMRATGDVDTRNSIGKKIKLTAQKVKWKKELVDAIRVADIPSHTLALPKSYLTEDNIVNINRLIGMQRTITQEKIIEAYNVQALNQIPQDKYQSIITRLNKVVAGERKEVETPQEPQPVNQNDTIINENGEYEETGKSTYVED